MSQYEEDKARLSVDEQRALAPQDVTHVPRFRVDLDAPPIERWAPIVAEYQHELLAIRDVLRQEIGDMVGANTLRLLDTMGSTVGPLVNYFVRETR